MKVLRKVRITCRVCSLTMHSNKSHLCKEMTVIRYLSQTCHIVGHFITKFGIWRPARGTYLCCKNTDDTIRNNFRFNFRPQGRLVMPWVGHLASIKQNMHTRKSPDNALFSEIYPWCHVAWTYNIVPRLPLSETLKTPSTPSPRETSLRRSNILSSWTFTTPFNQWENFT